jgi:hypothetical protein
MVARLLRCSVSLALKPKSAVEFVSYVLFMARELHTDLHITTSIEQNVVTLDISVNNILVVEMLQALASLCHS